MASEFFSIIEGDSPVVAAAIHNGHSVRDEIASLLAFDEASRLREEDPYTGQWTTVAPTQIVGLRSRFEVDLNRPRNRAIYRCPADAWGLRVWNDELPTGVAIRSLEEYDAFYRRVRQTLARLERKFGGFVVLDLHTYNHRRGGPDAPPDDPAKSPQVNVGTGSMDRAFWAPLVDRFVADLQAFDFPGGRLDVREDVRFRGGHFATWIHEQFPKTGCALAIEIKKIFMNEWTGEPDEPLLQAVGEALQFTVPGVLEQLRCLQARRNTSQPRSATASSERSAIGYSWSSWEACMPSFARRSATGYFRPAPGNRRTCTTSRWSEPISAGRNESYFMLVSEPLHWRLVSLPLSQQRTACVEPPC